MTDDKMNTLAQATFRTAGIPEVSVEFVHETLGTFKLVDCREPMELEGPLGAIEGVENVPMMALGGAAQSWGDEPVVILCRSGARSGHAATALEGMGLKVVSMAGGMIAWREAGFPVR